MREEREARLNELEQAFSKYGLERFIHYYGNKAFEELKCLRIAKQMEKKDE